MNHVEQLGGAAGFIRLQMSDQVPSRRTPSHSVNFWFSFLYAILTKLNETDVNGMADYFGRMSLGNSDKLYVCRGSIAALRGSFNPRTNAAQARTQLVGIKCSCSHSRLELFVVDHDTAEIW